MTRWRKTNRDEKVMKIWQDEKEWKVKPEWDAKLGLMGEHVQVKVGEKMYVGVLEGFEWQSDRHW